MNSERTTDNDRAGVDADVGDRAKAELEWRLRYRAVLREPGVDGDESKLLRLWIDYYTARKALKDHLANTWLDPEIVSIG